MPRNRRIRKRRGTQWTSESSERANKARWDAERARRDAEMPDRIREIAEIEAVNLPRRQGDAIGCLQWTDYRTGKITKRIIEIGSRRDQIVVRQPDGTRSRSHGWTWFLDHLRNAICQHKI